ncbi:S8 family serine peptidase [Ornithinimicrobium faecis]|uniref:S8 family serine peptidase n=1 Tax=Ornithinimicrobium faecis TaxID=2934158 RepID=A0ABY4YST2_9MICO|nr:S8 family serine peptidase [Ornithinimicrobium sp. HY1793]USQ79656.1 S8 family serine peptidase [Ornithinimicrobium sp. HY1793]
MPGQRPFPRLRLLTGAALAATVGLAPTGAAAPQPVAAQPEQEHQHTNRLADATVTLVTGDRVTLHATTDPDQEPEVSVVDASGAPSRGYALLEDEDGVHVIPHSVTALVPEVLDPDLFNVTRLVDLGYDDATTDRIPLLVQHESSTAMSTSLSAASGLAVDLRLDSINAVAGDLDKASSAGFLSGLSGTERDTVNRDMPQALTDAGVSQVWLDGTVESAALDHYLEQVSAPSAWDLDLDGEGITIAVLDSGVDADHPDLIGQVKAEQNFTDSPDATDRNGHGTHVASLAAGSGAGNDGQRQGTAPGAALLSGKVLGDTGEGQESWVIAGMEWAVDEGADVVNLSLSGTADSQNPVDQALEALVAESDTLFVAAAGNSGGSTGGSYSIGTPGTSPSALTVGAVTSEDRLASFSSRGPTWGTYLLKPDLVAPGVELLAARAGARGEDLYTPKSGTSMASPVVAGAAALLRQQHPDWTAQQVKARLMSTSDGTTWYTAWTYGAGRLDLAAATTGHLTTSRPSLDFGVLQWPHEGTVQDTTVITNTGAGEVSLDVTAFLEGELTAPAPEGAIAVSPASLSLGAGESAEVTVTLDRDLLAVAPWQGILSLDPADGGQGLRIPVGAYLEPESYELDLQVLDANGDPWDPSAGAGQIGVDPTIPIFNGRTGGFIRLHPDANGHVNHRIPAGEWMVLARVFTPGTSDDQGTVTITGSAALTVEEDTAYVLDARNGQPLEPASVTGHPTVPELGVPFIYSRRGDGRGYAEIVYHDPQAVLDGRIRYTPTSAVEHGTFEAITRWWLTPTAPVTGQGADAYDVLASRPTLDAGLTPTLTKQDLGDRPRVDQTFHPVGSDGSYAVAAITGMGQIGARFGFEAEVATPGEREVLLALPEDHVWIECLRPAANDFRQLCSDDLHPSTGQTWDHAFAPTLHPVLGAAWHSADSIYLSTGFSDGLHRGPLGLSTVLDSRLELQDTDGTTLGVAEGTYAYFRDQDQPGRFRLVQDLDLVPGEVSALTHAQTTWEFASRPPEDGEGHSTVPTLLDIDYGFDLEPEGTVGIRPVAMDLRVTPSTGTASAERITRIELAASSDDGDTWHELRTRRTDDTSFHSLVTPRVLRGAEHLSFRVTAVDAVGHQIEQTTIRLLTVD